MQASQTASCDKLGFACWVLTAQRTIGWPVKTSNQETDDRRSCRCHSGGPGVASFISGRLRVGRQCGRFTVTRSTSRA